MEAMKDALQFVFEVLIGLFRILLETITKHIPEETLTTSIIIIGTIAIIYMIIKLSSKTPKRRRKYRKY